MSPLRRLRRWEDAVARGRLAGALYRSRGLVLFAAVAVGFVGSFVHLQRYPDLRQAARTPAADPAEEARGGDGVDGLDGADGAGGAGAVPADAPDAGAVGPRVGEDLPGYLAARRAELAGLADPTAHALAVVSFHDYRTADETAALVPGTADVLEVQYRLPLTGEPPVGVPVQAGEELRATVRRVVAEARARHAEEEQEVDRLLGSGTVEEDGFRADLERRRTELGRLLDLLGPDAPVVFAVALRAPVAELRALSGHPAVRLVDVAAGDADAPAPVFYGVLPDDRERASSGRPS